MSRARWLVPVALALVLAGCSSGSAGSGTTSAPTSSGETSAPQDAAPAAERPGGAVNGLIAYVSGDLMQVQDSDMQTAVTWTADTQISAEVAGTLADVVPGVCVTATLDESSDAATSVAVTQPVDGECSFGFGGSGGTAPGSGGWPPSGMPTDLPTDLPGGMPADLPSAMPGGMPSGAPDGATWGRALGLRSGGLVTAVDGSTITLQVAAGVPGAAGAGGTDGDAAGGESDGSSTSTVTVGPDTAYTTTTTANAGALVVGQCVLGFGDADASGKVTATSLTVSAPVDGSCVTSVRGGLGGGRPGGDSGAVGLEEAGGDA